ncbi:MAG TPA: biopolymer transporter ExbD [Candidatus Cloacimonadota bacterium]|nr:biopolymer transporter ExbD [Candidatus Cloacimonadota bacterium]
MKISRKRKGGVSIPTASTGDIAFLLIIFFMSTTKFDVKEGLKLVLPAMAPDSESAVKAETIQLGEDKMTRLQILEDGSIILNKEAARRIEDAELDVIIQNKLRVNQDMIFRVITDRNAQYNDMIRVVDRLKAQKAEKISLSTN